MYASLSHSDLTLDLAFTMVALFNQNLHALGAMPLLYSLCFLTVLLKTTCIACCQLLTESSRMHAGKTLLARAVANRTDACFIRVIGSELVQKYVGEGARMVRELFQMARSKKACLIFFDEVDAIGGARFDDGAGKLRCYCHMLCPAASCFQLVWVDACTLRFCHFVLCCVLGHLKEHF